MAASSSKARARPILRDVSSSDESSNEILLRQFSLLSPRMPRLHSIKSPFKLVLGGILSILPRSRTRRTEFKLIERLPDQLILQRCSVFRLGCFARFCSWCFGLLRFGPLFPGFCPLLPHPPLVGPVPSGPVSALLVPPSGYLVVSDGNKGFGPGGFLWVLIRCPSAPAPS